MVDEKAIGWHVIHTELKRAKKRLSMISENICNTEEYENTCSTCRDEILIYPTINGRTSYSQEEVEDIAFRKIMNNHKVFRERIKELEAENEYLKQYRRSATTCQECYDDGYADGLAENKTIKELRKENEKLKKYQVYADLEKYLEEISQTKPDKRELEYRLFITERKLSSFKDCNDILIQKLIIAEDALKFYAEPSENKPDNEAKKALKEMNALRLGKDVKNE